MRKALSIAGSDSSGGAGIQADLKTFAACGVYGTCVVTSITAQNTVTIEQSFELPVELIRAQMDAVFSDFKIGALKTGMLSSSAIVETVAQKLGEVGAKNLVIDPVIISKSGFPLLKSDALENVKSQLLPLATLVTPNIYEAELLTGFSIKTLHDVKRAAEYILGYGCHSVLIKGGHLPGEKATDVLFDGREFRTFDAERINVKGVHGTGCTFSAAITAHLARGEELTEAILHAKEYTTNVIRYSLDVGKGFRQAHHFYFLVNK